MTPLAKHLHKYANLLFVAADEFKENLQKAVCFDVSQVLDLADETFKSSIVSTMMSGEKGPVFNHGGLLINPSEYTWLEFDTQKFADIVGNTNPIPYKSKIGILVHTFEDELSLSIIESNFDVGYDVRVAKGFVVLKNEDYCSCHLEQSTRKENEWMACFISLAVSLIVIINAPYGIERETAVVHKGQARAARREGWQLLPHHIIKLSKSAPPSEYSGNKTDIKKAFHFVRSHARNYKSGIRTVVKAHWRGDPRLGIHRADYKVVP